MALFSRKEKASEKPEVVKKATVNTSQAKVTDRNLAAVILGPRITEKSVSHGDKQVYTFNVRRDSTKHEVFDAIKAIYGVTPVKVNTVNKKPAVRLSGSKSRMVKESGQKKAYVYLKKGDTINLV